MYRSAHIVRLSWGQLALRSGFCRIRSCHGYLGVLGALLPRPKVMAQASWDSIVHKHQESLPEKQRRHVFRKLDFTTFNTEITTIFPENPETNFTRCLQGLTPVFEHLEGFMLTIDHIVPLSVEISGLVWGSLLIILIVSVLFFTSYYPGKLALNKLQLTQDVPDMLEPITTWLMELKSLMPLFELYTDDQPRIPKLEVTIRDIYDLYVSFLSEIVKHLSRGWLGKSSILIKLIGCMTDRLFRPPYRKVQVDRRPPDTYARDEDCVEKVQGVLRHPTNTHKTKYFL